MAMGLALPPLLYFAFSMSSDIDIGVRHILPVYPFLYVGVAAWLSRAIEPAARDVRAGRAGVLQIGECARITPDYLAFFNELAGGPGKGPEYLVDSNIDWGQDIKKLGTWLQKHTGARRARVYYFGNAQMRYYGIDEMGYPEPMDRKGWDAIDEFCVASVTPLQGVYVPLDALARLRMREPVAKIGWSMYVYDLRKPKRNAGGGRAGFAPAPAERVKIDLTLMVRCPACTHECADNSRYCAACAAPLDATSAETMVLGPGAGSAPPSATVPHAEFQQQCG